MKRLPYLAYLVIVGLLALGVPTEPPSAFAQVDTYYLTRANHEGTTADLACGSGYHMASVAELKDFSIQQYVCNPRQSCIEPVQGEGPPILIFGWARAIPIGSVPWSCKIAPFNTDNPLEKVPIAGVALNECPPTGRLPSNRRCWNALPMMCSDKLSLWFVSNPINPMPRRP